MRTTALPHVLDCRQDVKGGRRRGGHDKCLKGTPKDMPKDMLQPADVSSVRSQ